MKTQYIQPEVQVTEIQCVTVIAASGGLELFNASTDQQW